MTTQGQIRDFVLSTDVPTFVQIIMAFTLGVLFAPFSYGLLYFLIFLIGYEAIAIYLSQMDCRYWCFRTRVAVIIASIAGFLIGRWVDGRHDLLEDDKKKSKRSFVSEQTSRLMRRV